MLFGRRSVSCELILRLAERFFNRLIFHLEIRAIFFVSGSHRKLKIDRTCHPLFSDITLQSQILVIESWFLTSVSKFIRKYLLSRQFSYMYSSCSNPATSLVKFSDNFFQEKLSTNESSITGT